MRHGTGTPDYDAAFAVLEAREREVMAGLVDTLGLDDWLAVPGLRCVIFTAAALRLSADINARHPRLTPTGSLREACGALGAGARSGTVAASIARNLRRWQAAAAELCGKGLPSAALLGGLPRQTQFFGVQSVAWRAPIDV